MLSGEYAVLYGAKALALPTKKGQSLEIDPNKGKSYHSWQAFDNQNKVWLEVNFSLNLQNIIDTNDDIKAEFLQKILFEIYKFKPELFGRALNFKTILEFDPNWGLGSSSTLINNLANWSGIEALDLLKKTFGGSGYDIAVAKEKKALIYQLKNNFPVWKTMEFNNDFLDQIYFVYLNRKQNSREAIKLINNKKIPDEIIERISQITEQLSGERSLNEFKNLLEEHEQILSKILSKPTIKDQYFSDYLGTIKSLGAWGGDFIMAVGSSKTPDYFKEKGFRKVFKYRDFIH